MKTWHDFVEKSAVSFNDDRTIFTLDKGETPTHAARALGVPVSEILLANPGVSDRRFMANKEYKAPAVQQPQASNDAMADQINRAIEAVQEFTKSQEDFRSKAYNDEITGTPTVGHGLTTIPDPVTGEVRAVRDGDTISEEDSDRLVKKRHRQNAVQMYKNIPYFRLLDQNTQSAMLDKAFNAGWGIFTRSRSPNLYRKWDVQGSDKNQDYWSEHDTYTSAGGKSNVKGLVNRQAASRETFGPK